MSSIFRSIFAITLISSLLSGCGATQPDISGSMNRLEKGVSTVTMKFMPRRDTILKESSDSISDSVGDFPHGTVAGAVIYLPEEAKHKSSLNNRRVTAIQKKLKGIGIDSSNIHVAYDSSRDTGDADQLETDIVFYNMKLADCEKQRIKIGDYYMNYKSRDLGCMSNHNLGAMLYDKRHAMTGKPDAPQQMDSTNAVSAVTAYRASYVSSSGSSSSGSESSSSSSSSGSGQ